MLLAPPKQAAVNQRLPSIPFLPGLPYAEWAELPFDGSVRKAKRITADEERTWFRQMHRARFQAAELHNQCDAGDENDACWAEIQRLLQRANAIRNELAYAFPQLTLSIAARHMSRHNSFDELASEAYFTLLRAIARFNPERGFRFSTRAIQVVRGRLQTFMRQRQKARVAAGAWPSEEPVLDLRRRTPAYNERVMETTSEIERLLAQLSARERYVIRSRFGWEREFDARTLRDIADEFGVTHQCVRQIEQRALKKLRTFAAVLEIEL